MRTNLRVEGVIDKISKKGRAYKSIQTNQGLMSCFEDKVIEQLTGFVNGPLIDCDVQERNGFKNICAVMGPAVVTQPISLPAVETKPIMAIMQLAVEIQRTSNKSLDSICLELLAEYNKLMQIK